MAENSKKIHVFSSFEDEKRFEAQQQASLTYGERLEQLEVLRKMLYKEYLLSDGSWKPLTKRITITKA